MADKFDQMTDEELDNALLENMSDEELDAQLLNGERSDMEQRIEVPEEMQKANLLQAAQAGGIKSGANALQTLENVSRISQEYSPSSQLVNLATGRGKTFYNEPTPYEEGWLGKTAKKMTEYADTKIPERKGVLANVVEGGVQVPEKIAEIALVPGGLLTKLLVQGAVGGAEGGVGGMAVGAGTNAILGTILGGTSMLKPAAIKSVSPAMKKTLESLGKPVIEKTVPFAEKAAWLTARTLIGGAAGAGLEGVRGATEGGSSGDKIAAEGILGVLLSISTGNSKSIVDLVKNFTSNMKRAKAAPGALTRVAKYRASQVEKAKGEASDLNQLAKTKVSEIEDRSKFETQMLTEEQSAKQQTAKQLEATAKFERDQQIFAENVDLANKLNNLDANILEVVKTNAVNLKEPYQQQFRQYSKDYDRVVWEPAAKKFDQETPLSYDQMTDLLNQVKSESMNDADVNFGNNFGIINAEIQKYNTGTDPNNPRIGKDGQPEILQDAFVPFKELIGIVRKMSKNVNFKDRPKADDIPYFILKRAVGDIITAGDPDHQFAIGQRAYSKVITNMNLASKMFEIYKPSTEAAERRLMSVAKKGDVLTGQQERVQDFLKKGTTEFPAKIKADPFSKLESLGKQRSVVDQIMKTGAYEKKYQTNYERRMGEIYQEINTITREINDKKVKLQNATQDVKNRVLSEIGRRVDELDKKIVDLSYIKQKTKSGQDINVHIDKIKENNAKALKARNKIGQLIQDAALVIGSGGMGANRMMLYHGVKSVKDLGDR